ncbi:MAG TPA: YtxH domain-containing protein [Smithella sp.]|nr:YtxH domain-containing protein [Smithella sp.]
MSDDNGNLLVGFIIGALVGATLGILFAPKSGRETREDIARNTDKLLVKAKDEYKKAAEKCTDAISGAESFKEYWEEDIEKPA